MSVQIDVLDDVLNTIRLNGAVYFQRTFSGDWGFETLSTPFKKFNIIAEGQSWLRADFLKEPIPLHSGDIVAFPHGAPYRISATPTSACLPIDDTLSRRTATPVLESEEQNVTTLIFGHIEFTRDFSHPFMQDIPELIHVRAEADNDLSWLHSVADLIVTETRNLSPGSRSVIKRLAEVLHLYTLRAHMMRQEGVGSFPLVYNAPAIYQSLQLIHNNIAQDWTLDQLAREVHLSRTVFATRFKSILGMPPMRYITLWRMEKAREQLEITADPIIAIALRVGYGSEAAFSRAFQRAFDETPGRYRQHIHDKPSSDKLTTRAY